MRHSLLHVNDKSDIMSMLSKEAKKETKKKEMKVDIRFEEWSKGENNDIYITKSRIVNDEFYKLLCNGNVYNNGITLCWKCHYKRHKDSNFWKRRLTK